MSNFVAGYDDDRFSPYTMDPQYAYGVVTTVDVEEKKGLSIDAPSFRSLSGLIIVIILVMIVISLFICLGRTDFNLTFYFLGYYLWCLESEAIQIAPFHPRQLAQNNNFRDNNRGNFRSSWKTHFLCTRKMYKSVQQYTILLVAASVVDISWLLLAFSTWMCEVEDENRGSALAGKLAANVVTVSSKMNLSVGQNNSGRTWCFTGENSRMALVFGMHQFVLFASVVNLFLKMMTIVLSFVWLSSGKSHLYESRSSN